MVVFYGNEISIGLMLASWLFWTAVGSSLAGHLVGEAAAPQRIMAAIQVLLAFVLPGTIVAVRSAKAALQTVPGEMLGPGVMVLASLTVLSLFCMLSGALFTAGSRLYGRIAAAPVRAATGSVYLWEAVGSSGGGVLAGLVLVRVWGSIEIAGLLSLVNLLAACTLGFRQRPFRFTAMAGLVGVSAMLVLAGGISRLEAGSQRRFWRGLPLIATRTSVYGSLAVVGTERSRSLYENGTVLFNVPDPAAAEEAVHYALLEHAAPRSLLLIGGGLNGSIAQALRHPSLERVDYVELDPAILELGREYFPAQWAVLEADRRVRLHVADGRLYLKTTDSTFDVIIVNVPDPQTAQINRFYTVEFFEEAARKLTAGGVLSLRLTASENYISPELAEFLRSIQKSLRAVFPEVMAIPGESVHFFASSRADVLAPTADELLLRLRARHLATEYVSEYFVPFRMSPDRMSDLESQIRPDPATPINHDFAPIAYYFDVALWSSRFSSAYGSAFHAMAGVDFGALAIGLGLLLLALVAGIHFSTRRERRIRAAAAGCTTAMGFTLIGLEILLLLAFQAIYGYVYQQLAILIGALMAGMALGSAFALRAVNRGLRTLARLQLTAALAPLALCGLLATAARVQSPSGLPLIGQVLFPSAALLCGILGGYEFPIASRIFFASGPKRGPGTLYALDLAGSCLGAMFFSVYLVPVFGFFRTAALIALVSLAPALMAILSTAPAHQEAPLAPEAGRRIH
jgi:spermidine synthase